MVIGLCQVDGKIPNLALAKLAAWWKWAGEAVERFSPLREYDRLYASKVFTNTPDNPYLPESCIKGGSGYILESILDPKIERIMPDFSLWSGWDRSIGFTTRGCVRRCSFCIVPEKEGDLRVVSDLYGIWNGSRELMLLDNNLTAAPMKHFELICKQAIKEGVRLDFSQGLDIRLVNEQHASWLARVKTTKQIRFAWDNVGIESAVRRGLDILAGAGIKPHRLMFYVLIGFDTTEAEDLYRILTLDGLGVDPFVMPYNTKDDYQRHFARWCNHKAIFKTVEWHKYLSDRQVAMRRV